MREKTLNWNNITTNGNRGPKGQGCISVYIIDVCTYWLTIRSSNSTSSRIKSIHWTVQHTSLCTYTVSSFTKNQLYLPSIILLHKLHCIIPQVYAVQITRLRATHSTMSKGANRLVRANDLDGPKSPSQLDRIPPMMMVAHQQDPTRMSDLD